MRLVSEDGFAILLAMTFFSIVLVATFWSTRGGIAVTIFAIADMVYFDRLQAAVADSTEGSE